MEAFLHDNIEEYIDTQVDYVLGAEFRDIGLKLIDSTSKSVTIQDRRFRSHFGLNWVQASIVWQGVYPDVLNYYARKKPPKKHLFFALRFLKTYDTEMNGASFFKCDEKTLRNWTWKYVEAIALLEGEKVRKKNCLISFYFISHSYHFVISSFLNI